MYPTAWSVQKCLAANFSELPAFLIRLILSLEVFLIYENENAATEASFQDIPEI
jgi:hypothetical protein